MCADAGMLCSLDWKIELMNCYKVSEHGRRSNELRVAMRVFQDMLRVGGEVR